MFAEGEEVDVLHDDHLRVVFLEEGIGEHLVGIHLVASGEHLHRLCHAHGGLHQALALRVLAQEGQDLLVVVGQLFKSLTVVGLIAGVILCLVTHGYCTVIFPLTMMAES